MTQIRPDIDLEFIDRMSQRYLGVPYQHRDAQPEVFLITPERIDTSRGGQARRRQRADSGSG